MLKKYYKLTLSLLFIGWTAFILYGSLAPGDNLPKTGWLAWLPHYDKWIHFGFYFIEVVLLLLLFRPRRVGAWLTVLFVIACSAGIEYIQGRYMGRSADIWDLAANTTGALTAFAITPVFRKKLIEPILTRKDHYNPT